MASCLEDDNLELPDKILDLGTLSITIDNRGIARLSVTVLINNTDIIYGVCGINLGDSTFNGTIVEDNPTELLGTEYYEHHISAIGMIE